MGGASGGVLGAPDGSLGVRPHFGRNPNSAQQNFRGFQRLEIPGARGIPTECIFDRFGVTCPWGGLGASGGILGNPF